MRAKSIANRLAKRVYFTCRAIIVTRIRTPMSIMSDLLLDKTRKLVYFGLMPPGPSFDLSAKLTTKSTWFSQFSCKPPTNV